MVWYHIHYINLDARFHFLIYEYGIFPYLRRTISYSHTISEYDVFLTASYTSVSMLDYIPTLFDLISTTFITRSLVGGSPICSVYTCFHTIITSRKFANRDPYRAFVKNLHACALCFSMKFTRCCLQRFPEQIYNIYRCA